MTAEALKIMTSPTKTRIMDTVNIQRSTLTRLAIENHFTTETRDMQEFQPRILGQRITELVPSRPVLTENRELGTSSRGSRHGQRMHNLFEQSTAMLVALELVKTGARR